MRVNDTHSKFKMLKNESYKSRIERGNLPHLGFCLLGIIAMMGKWEVMSPLQRACNGWWIWYRLRLVWSLVLDFHQHDKHTWDRINLKEKRFFFFHGSQFQSIVGWLCCFWSFGEVAFCCGSWTKPLKYPRCKKREEGRGLLSPSRAHLQWPNFLPLGSASWRFPRLPIAPPSFHTWTRGGTVQDSIRRNPRKKQ